MSIVPGSRVGPYEVASAIGSGGMGQVFRARDTKLQRDVALKLLPDDFAADSDRLARFQREAQLLASLNHPNIAQIYGLEDSNSTPCIVMELVEGETLDERLNRGPIPVDETIRLAREIADALEAAHDRGIIHRDLKPANIKVTPEGKIKVLDFGLAKAFADTREVNVSNSPTMSMVATQQGIILGTAAYMSPEQARGRSVDKRTDVWAFACVVYEMLTARPAFDGSDVSELLASVIKSEPAWDELPATVPPIVRTFLRRCLEKDPKRRIHDIADVRLALEGAFDVPVVQAMEPMAGSKLTGWSRAIASSLIAALITGIALWSFMRPERPSIVRLGVAQGPAPFGTPSPNSDLDISPDGRRIVYASGESAETAQMFVRPLDQLDPILFRGLNWPRNPFISPDGNWVGFFEGSSLKKIAMNGGPPVTICSVAGNPRGASWGPGDVVIFATSESASGLLRVRSSGGEPEVLTKPASEKGEFDHQFPEILPGGQAVLFTIIPAGGLIENAQIAVLDFKTGTQRVLIRGGSNPRYAASGHIVYAVSGTLRAVPFNLGALEVRGDPIPVAERVVVKAGGAANFSMADDGSLVYVTGASQSSAERTLVWVDREGREEPINVQPRAYAYPRISPDGTRVALDIRDQENDIWIWEFARRTMTRLTFDRGLNRGIAWTPDSKRLAFSAQRDGTENLYWQSADGTGSAERLSQAKTIEFPQVFTPDGTRLIFEQPDSPPYDLMIVNVKGERKIEPLLTGPLSELNVDLSPDGRWLAYESNESGQTEVYVRPFPDINGGRWQISTGGGTRPVWAKSGRELFYYAVPAKVVAVPIQSGATFVAGTPQTLFEGRYLAPFTGRTYDVSPDGRRFLMIKDARTTDPAAPPPQLVVVLNWFEELKRLVSPK